MKRFYLVQHVHRGCLQEPEIMMSKPKARRLAIQTLLEDGDLEGSEVSVVEMSLVPLGLRTVFGTGEIADLARAEQVHTEMGAELATVPFPSTVVAPDDFEPMTRLIGLAEGVLEERCLGKLQKPADLMSREISFKRGLWELHWEYIGEGRGGDHDPDDPEDEPLLRADLSFDMEHVESLCTLAPVATCDAELERLSGLLFDTLESDPGSPKHRFAAWTWKTGEMK